VDLDSATIAQPDESVDAVGREKVTFEHLDRDYGAPGNEERFTIKRDDEPANRAGLGLPGYEVSRPRNPATSQPFAWLGAFHVAIRMSVSRESSVFIGPMFSFRALGRWEPHL
jgi:hypothetical protein